MAKRYFRGEIDLSKLGMEELSKATSALSVLEKMAGEGHLTFVMGISRSRKETPETLRRMQPQQVLIHEALTGDRWWSVREVAQALGLNENSVSAQLATMTGYGWLETTMGKREAKGRPRGRRTVNLYRSLAADGGPGDDG